MKIKLAITLGLWTVIGATAFSQTPTPEVALQYKPSQKDVEYDSPLVADVKKCRVELEKFEKNFGFAVYEPNGLILRRYFDANGDRYIDAWRYYKNGIEVYRDIDSDFDQKIDQVRWLNTGGTRWGVDKNQDGKIDSWKFLSAEEATRVAVNSLVSGDMATLSTVLITKSDLDSLGISDSIATELLRQVQEPSAAARTIMSKGLLTSQSKWTRMDASMPSLIPMDDKKATADLLVYEGAMTFVETGGKHGIVQIGEMIKVGDVWKLTQIPTPMSGNEIVTSAGLLMRPASLPSQGGSELTEKMQEILKQLEDLDKKGPGPNSTKAEFVAYHIKRKKIIERLIAEAQAAQQRDLWTQQLINTLVSLIQLGEVDAVKELRELEVSIQKNNATSPLLALIAFQSLFAQYSLASNTKDPKDQQKAHEKWFMELDKFVSNFPNSDQAVDALLQLAVNAEHNQKPDVARRYYKQLGLRKDVPGAEARANGALRRLDLVGTTFKLSGKDVGSRTIDVASLRGKAYVVCFWEMNSLTFNEDLPVLKALLEQYAERGFAIVGICTDQDTKAITTYVTTNKVNFPSIHDPASNENFNTLAMQYGIYKNPLMFLVDRDGKVVSNDITVNDLKTKLAEAFKK